MSLDYEIRNCTRCTAVLSSHPENPPSVMRSVEPKPILSPPICAKIMLVGQAPGLTEYKTGRPFSGPAGDAIRQLFSACGVRFMDFDRLVYQTSAVKCFPGRRKNRDRWEDHPPCSTMVRNCSGFLARQIEQTQPKLIVTLGGVAARTVDELRGIPRRALSDVAGTRESWGEVEIVFLAHTSGGSRFLNDQNNKLKQERGKAAIAEVLQSLG